MLRFGQDLNSRDDYHFALRSNNDMDAAPQPAILQRTRRYIVG
jgi:hypothetical protein